MKKILVVWLLFSFQGLFTAQVQQFSQKFSVMTWNILGPWAPDIDSFFGFKGAEDTDRLGRIGQWIEYWGADVVCLQEFGGPYAEAMLKGGTLGKHAYQDVVPHYFQVAKQEKDANAQGHITAGTAIYLKQSGNLMPVVDAQNQRGIKGGIKTPGRSVCAWVLLQNHQGEKILVASVHIGRANERQGQQTGEQEWGIILQQLLPILQHYKCATVMVGDFNTLYEEVFDETSRMVTNVLGSDVVFWMYRHSSWTANSIIGGNYGRFRPMDNPARQIPYAQDETMFEFSAIDHVLYSQHGLPVNLEVDSEGSWVGDGNYRVVEQHVEKPRKIVYDSFTLKPIHTIFPSDHLPIHVTFNCVSASHAAVPSQAVATHRVIPVQGPVVGAQLQTTNIVNALKLAVKLGMPPAQVQA